MSIMAFAAQKAERKLEPIEYELGALKPDEVEIDVEYCGIYYGDLIVLKNDRNSHGSIQLKEILYLNMPKGFHSLNYFVQMYYCSML